MLGEAHSTELYLGRDVSCSSSHLTQHVTLVEMRVLSLQRLGAGVHDRHHNRVDAALPQTGAHSKTLPRYPHFTLNSCVLLFFTPFSS